MGRPMTALPADYCLRCQRVFFSSFLCFFLRIFLRRFLTTEGKLRPFDSPVSPQSVEEEAAGARRPVSVGAEEVSEVDAPHAETIVEANRTELEGLRRPLDG